MPYTTRLATPDDAAILARLRYEFRASIGESVESEAEFVPRCAPWMSARLAPGGPWRCWIAVTDQDVPVGNLWLQLIDKIPNPTPELEQHGYVTNVYVTPESRGARLGETLLETALAWCRENAIDQVILWPTPRSRTLYTRHGFSPPPDILSKSLNTEARRHGEPQ